MLRTWALLSVTAVTFALLVIGASRADDDDDKSPLAKIMVKIDKETKAIKNATATREKFKAAGNGKAILDSTKVLVEKGKETRKFEEPSKKMKKPLATWVDMTDRYLTSVGELSQAAKKGDLVASRKAYTALNVTCSNCHGAFRPEVGDGF